MDLAKGPCDVNIAVCKTLDKGAFSDVRRMTVHGEHPCPPSTSHAPRMSTFQIKKSSAYIRTAPRLMEFAWCSALDQ
ncbi:hypothetical protein EVAR_103696_1 [Eumeta japonica]|uniref:Uncharacterized protein n=1 Tax=Eumeta variegata TaxID=151549 RepID=A0A4C2A089_EUMVA|nr:hypothetical protein EVAR_103696_1 [Eumeta japonica]